MVDGWLQAASSQQQMGWIVLLVSWNINATSSVEKTLDKTLEVKSDRYRPTSYY
jgi:hypothetical protein